MLARNFKVNIPQLSGSLFEFRWKWPGQRRGEIEGLKLVSIERVFHRKETRSWQHTILRQLHTHLLILTTWT